MVTIAAAWFAVISVTVPYVDEDNRLVSEHWSQMIIAPTQGECQDRVEEIREALRADLSGWVVHGLDDPVICEEWTE